MTGTSIRVFNLSASTVFTAIIFYLQFYQLIKNYLQMLREFAMKSIVRFAVKHLCRNLKIKDIASNVPWFKSVKKQLSVNGKNERLRHAFKVWNTACYKAF